jgi:hypothetical protein
MARSDVEVVLLSYDPDAKVWMRSMSGVGISGYYHGYEGIRTLYADLDEAFDDWRWTIRGVVDGGDRLAVRGDFVGYGRSSGAETALNNGGTAVKLSARGSGVWQEWFAEQDGWKRPSKPSGCRSRRCRRRTWSLCAEALRPTRGAISTRHSLAWIPRWCTSQPRKRPSTGTTRFGPPWSVGKLIGKSLK